MCARHAGFLTEYDLYTDEELGADPIYRELLWPAGLGWVRGYGDSAADRRCALS